MKNNTDYEAIEQEKVVKYPEELLDKGDILEFSAIPSSTFTRSWNQKRKNKAMGVRKGVPDLMIVAKNTLLFIELKRLKGGVTSKEQKRFITHLNSTGAVAVVCKGAEEAKTAINDIVLTRFEHYPINIFTDYLTFTHYLLQQQEKWKV
jgi:hypothetical protein